VRSQPGGSRVNVYSIRELVPVSAAPVWAQAKRTPETAKRIKTALNSNREHLPEVRNELIEFEGEQMRARRPRAGPVDFDNSVTPSRLAPGATAPLAGR
jgi:hypothetical protein